MEPSRTFRTFLRDAGDYGIQSFGSAGDWLKTDDDVVCRIASHLNSR